jgi:SAM-dependent methyltransferase
VDFDQLQTDWEGLAADDPLWAVLTRPDCRGGRWDPDEFFTTGSDEVADIIGRVRRLRPRLWPGRALDFGCGVGRLTRPLADHFDEVVGVDIAPTMIDLARRYHADRPTCRFEVNQAEDLARFPDDSFDLVLSLIVLQHVPPTAAVRYVREFCRVLAPGGVVVVQIPAGPVDPVPSVPLDPAAFRARLQIVDAVPSALPGEAVAVVVDVRNDSPVRWPVSAGAPVQIGNHWTTTDGSLVVNDDGRAPLPRPLGPGERTTVTLESRVPAVDTGSLRLVIDLVQEGVCWFADAGSEVAAVDIAVEAAAGPVAPVVAAPGGPFDERMRMHGLARTRVEAALTIAGVKVLEVTADDRAGDTWESFLYIATKEPRRRRRLRRLAAGRQNARRVDH